MPEPSTWRKAITALCGGDDLASMRTWLICPDRFWPANLSCDEYGWWAHIQDTKDCNDRDPDGLADTAEEALATGILKRHKAMEEGR